jgi:hypothetical protein
VAAIYEPPASDDRGPLVIRPSWRALGRGLLPTIAGATLVLLVGSVKFFGISERLTWVAAMFGISGLTLAGYGLYQAAYMIRARITVTADAILVTHWFSSSTRVALGDIRRVVRCSVGPTPAGSVPKFPEAVVFAFSATGRCILSLYANRWDQRDLDRIWRHLGIRPEGSWNDVIPDEELGFRFPGAF